MIEDGVNGFVVDVDDADSVAKSIMKLNRQKTLKNIQCMPEFSLSIRRESSMHGALSERSPR